MIFGKHINRYYLRFSYMLLLGLLSLAAVDWLQLLIPNLYQMVINGINHGFVELEGAQAPFDTAFLLDRVCMPMVWIILSIVAGRFLWRVMFFGAAIRTEEHLRNRMFGNARHLSQSYYQKNKVGNLMSLFTNDLDTVQECFAWGVMMFLDALILGGLAIFRMMQMDLYLTLLSMIPTLLLLACATLIGKRMMRQWETRQAAFSRLSDFSQESFSGVSVVKAFVKEAKELMAFGKLNRENETANVRFTRTAVLMRILVTFFVESVICIILGYGGWMVYQGRFNAGQLVEFIGYYTAIIWPVMAVSELIDMTSRGKASLKRISELLDAEPDVTDAPGAVELADARGELRFEHLTFRYPGGEFDALKDITVTIRAGENVGLVGRTGAGKTTLVDLLLRTYNVPDGTLFIDGHDVNTLTLRSLRDAFACVPQDNYLFSDTIASNIAFACDGEDAEKIAEAARLSDVDGDIRGFAEGYGTVLGERGLTVSGGQKQRISIARALMKDAPVLILDDSVSAVDTRTERNILSALRETRKGKTTILIAHRISTIEQMDRLLFLEDGRLIAVGTHEELYESCPAYHRLVELQKLEEKGGEARV